MQAVIQLRADLASSMTGAVSSARSASPAPQAKLDIERELARHGLALRPMHPGTTDQELARYFTLTKDIPQEDESILDAIRQLDGITAAYLKPDEEPA